LNVQRHSGYSLISRSNIDSISHCRIGLSVFLLCFRAISPSTATARDLARYDHLTVCVRVSDISIDIISFACRGSVPSPVFIASHSGIAKPVDSDTASNTTPHSNKEAMVSQPAPYLHHDSKSAKSIEWKPLLLQSLMFNSIEQTWRITSDSKIRHLLATKPFWHDYAASLNQFNMRRWNDGDNFLVNYVGHPMQGAVSGFIEIQNDPVGRGLSFGKSRSYWSSRGRAFLWATAYSTQFEIGPLSEASIGNEGGWTYPINCHSPCPSYKPGKYNVTNNTGWVDFIITPVVGTLWIVTEDALDRLLQKRFAATASPHPHTEKLLRGALNPSRTFANALRGKFPWYRDAPYTMNRTAIGSSSGPDERSRREIALAPHLGLAQGSPEPNLVAGMDVSYRFSPFVGLSFDVSRAFQTDNPSLGNFNFTVGPSLHLRRRRIAIRFSPRAGILINSDRPNQIESSLISTTSSDNRFVWNLDLSVDYALSKRLSLRSSAAPTFIRSRSFDDNPGRGQQPYLTFLSKENYTTQTRWACSAGPVFRF
jgi:hypothetical protein